MAAFTTFQVTLVCINRVIYSAGLKLAYNTFPYHIASHFNSSHRLGPLEDKFRIPQQLKHLLSF